MPRSLLCGCCLALLEFCTSSLCGQISYTFDNLSNGALTVSTLSGTSGNQDGWYSDNALASSIIQIGDGTGSPAPGKVVIVPAGTNGRAFRICNRFFTGTETSAVLQFDFQLTNTGGGLQLALAGNGSTNSIDSNSQNRFSPKIVVAGGNGQAVFTLFPKSTNGVFGNTVSQTISGLVSGHWYQARLVMNLTANSGNASGSLSYRDLTAGCYGYSYPNLLQNINLGLTNNASGYGPSGWNQLWIRADGASSTASLPMNNLYVAPATVQTSYYVSPTGSDSNNGLSPTTPFQSLTKARDSVRILLASTLSGNIEVILRGGVYALTSPLSLTEADSGKNGYSVIWRAYPNEQPVLSGAIALTGWTLFDSSKNIWRASAISGLETRQIYINDVRAIRARSNGSLTAATYDSNGHTTTDLFLATWKNPGDLEMVYQSKWAQSRCGVATISSSGSLATLTMKQPGWSYCRSSYSTAATVPAYYENAYELLDTPGEWYLDRTGAVNGTAGTVYYIPRSGESMTSANIYAARTESLLTITGSSLDAPALAIQFLGIRFQYATWLYPNSNNGHADVQANVTLDASGHTVISGAAVAITNAQNLVFERCDFMNLGAAGINFLLGSQTITVQGCRFYDLSGAGIQIGIPDSMNSNYFAPSDSRSLLKSITVTNNYFNSIGTEYASAVALLGAWPQNLNIDHNTIYGVNYTGISVGWGWTMSGITANKLNSITNNYISNVMQALDDGGGIYILGNSGNITQSGTISGNFIGMVKNNNIGLYFDQGSSYYNASNNVFNLPTAYGPANWNQIWLRLDGTSSTTSLPVAHLVAGTYSSDFSTLSTGALTTSTICGATGNQDGWYADNAIATAVVQVCAGTGSPAPGNVVQSAVNSGGRALRICGPLFTGTESAAVMQFDFQAINTGGNAQMAAVGNGSAVAIDSNSQIKFGPRFCVTGGNGQVTFWISPKTTNGAFAASISQTVTGITSGHWYQVRLLVNFTANSGNGEGNLFYRDLTRGDSTFTTLNTLQQINLGLLYNAPRFVMMADNTIHDNATTNSYSNSPNYLNLGVNCTVTNSTFFSGQSYSATAQTLIDNAGLSPAFYDILQIPSP